MSSGWPAPRSVLVALPAGLAANLARSTAVLDEPRTDLVGPRHGLHEAFPVAVPSGLGVSVRIRVDADEVTVGAMGGATAAAATSLQVPLRSWTETEPGSAVVFYVGTAALTSRLPGGHSRRDVAGGVEYAWCGCDGGAVRAGPELHQVAQLIGKPNGAVPSVGERPSGGAAGHRVVDDGGVGDLAVPPWCRPARPGSGRRGG